ncbi:MAG: S8 family serine peptidase [Planctomycetes bacterium]|nr:S8 family serine peptidase [Planctomycetota bacterium]
MPAAPFAHAKDLTMSRCAPSSRVSFLLSSLCALGAAAAQTPAASVAPCDAVLRDGARARPVFVRMKAQLFAKGGDYEAWCADHHDAARRETRREVLARLHRDADDSWLAVRDEVEALEAAGELRELQRFWIVDGFACDATPAAVGRLCALPEVAYVHLQTQRGSVQHRHQGRDEPWLVEREADERRALQLLAAAAARPAAVVASAVPWNLEAVRAPAAWQLGATGEGVVVALLDSGVLCMEPLVEALWRNPGEGAAPDGVDDDHNGFVDDLFGWDFGGDTRFVVGDGEKSHGTMCGGIVAGRPWPVGEQSTVTGVAKDARLMVLRGMGSLRAYEYAAAMGADVLSMSYMWVGYDLGSYRGVFRTAHEHLAACGVVAVGGAGNFAQQQPEGRQIALPKDIPCVIAASGIGQDGVAPAFSSRGPCTWSDVPFFLDFPPSAPLQKPDVAGCAAGFPVWHRAEMEGRPVRVQWRDDAGYGLIVGPRGNSFSGPHAAGVAALVLSAAPDLMAFRVKEVLEQSCKDLGEPGRDTTYGAGLLQADAAVSAARAAVGGEKR